MSRGQSLEGKEYDEKIRWNKRKKTCLAWSHLPCLTKIDLLDITIWAVEKNINKLCPNCGSKWKG
ncbi:MAG: hypothetical protein M3297_13955 [Thermoproteota archaeon]|nr:hypothetical protein [Thermoproteota archaeon]